MEGARLKPASEILAEVRLPALMAAIRDYSVIYLEPDDSAPTAGAKPTRQCWY
jgi:hypothetical protein